MAKEKQPTTETQSRESPLPLAGLALRIEALAEEVRQLREIGQAQDIRPEMPTGEEVETMTEEQDNSITIKAGAKTYFFDLKQTRDNKPYLLITESRFKGEGEERERVSISVFPETAAAFGQAVAEMMTRFGVQTAE